MPYVPPQLIPRPISTAISFCSDDKAEKSVSHATATNVPTKDPYTSRPNPPCLVPSYPKLSQEIKNVNFTSSPESGLESFRIFRKRGKPQSVTMHPTASDTPEADNPFLQDIPWFTIHPRARTVSLPVYDIDRDASSIIFGGIYLSRMQNVALESLTMEAHRPSILRGSALVRNINYIKYVSVRFTLDEWHTVSDVRCHYEPSLGNLRLPTLINDPHGTDKVDILIGWDRFKFEIDLESFHSQLTDRILWLAVQYRVEGINGGEWWDNNDGYNYRIHFKVAADNSHMSASASHFPKETPIFARGSSFFPLASHGNMRLPGGHARAGPAKSATHTHDRTQTSLYDSGDVLGIPTFATPRHVQINGRSPRQSPSLNAQNGPDLVHQMDLKKIISEWCFNSDSPVPADSPLSFEDGTSHSVETPYGT